MKRILLAVLAILLAIAAQRWVSGDEWGAAALLYGAACVLYLVALPRDREPFPLGSSRAPLSRALLLSGGAACALALGLGIAGALRFRGDSPEAGGWTLHLLSLLLLVIGALLLDLAFPPSANPEERPARRWIAVGLVVLLAVAAFLRFSSLAEQPFGVWYDEAANALVARDILGNASYRPLYLGSTFHTAHHNYLVAAAFRILGDSIASARAVSALGGVLLVAAGYLAASELFHTAPSHGRRRSLVALTLGALMAVTLTVSAWSINFSRIAVNYIATPLFILLAIGFLLRGLRTQSLAAYTAAGVAVGLGLNFYTSFRLFLPVLPIFLVALLLARRELIRTSWRGLLLAAFAAALVAAPLLTFAASNRETFLRRTNDTYLLRNVADDQKIDVLWRNTQRHLLMFNLRGDPNGRHNLPGRPMLDPYLGGLFVVGVVACLWRWRRPHSILLLAWLGFTLLGGILTLDFEAPQSLRANGAIPAAYMIALLPIAEILRAWEKSEAGRYYPRTASAAALLILIPISVWNLAGYYSDQRHDFASWNSFSTAESLTARTMATLDPDQTDVFVISYYDGHPSIHYLAPQWRERYRRVESGAAVPLEWTPGKDAWVFLDTDSEALFERLRSLYPNGDFVEHRAPFSDAVSMRSAHLTQEDIASVQGLDLSYYASPTAEGEPLLSQRVPTIAADWSNQTPVPLPFAALYEGVLQVPEFGAYELRLETPGQSTLWIDETQVLSGTGRVEDALTLARGNHSLRLLAEGAPGEIALHWARPGGEYELIPSHNLLSGTATASGLLGRFFAGDNWEGEVQLAVIDPQMNIFYHIVPLERPFSAEWTGKLLIPLSGDYQFAIEAVDAAQILVDDQRVASSTQPGSTAEGNIYLEQGLHDIRILYQALTAHSRINLWWTPPGGARGPVPSQLLVPPRGNYDNVEIPTLAALAAVPDQSGESAPQPQGGAAGLAGNVTTVLDGLNRPAGVAVGSDGRVFVADTGNDRVLLLDGAGEILATVTGGSQPFEEPFDVATDTAGNAYVLDAEAAALRVLDHEGLPVHTLAPEPGAAGRSRGLDVAANGSIWIANTPGQRIVTLDADGAVSNAFPAWEGEDAQVVDVAVAADGSVFATATGIHRLVHYDAQGERLDSWTLPGANTMDGPHLAIGPSGAIFVTQPEEGRIARYGADGQPLGYWQLQIEPDRMKPVGIDVDGQGRIWVTDVEGGRLIRIDPVNEAAP